MLSEPSWPIIELEEVRFTSGVLFDKDGEPYRTPYPDVPDYFGPPTPEIDANWEALIGGESFPQVFLIHNNHNHTHIAQGATSALRMKRRKISAERRITRHGTRVPSGDT